MPRSYWWGGDCNIFCSTFVAIFSTTHCGASFYFRTANRSMSEKPSLWGFRITNPQRRSSWCRGVIDGEVTAISFVQFLLQYFQRRIVERVIIFIPQTEACPKSHHLQLSESPPPNAVALDAAELSMGRWRQYLFDQFCCTIFNDALWNELSFVHRKPKHVRKAIVLSFPNHQPPTP